MTDSKRMKVPGFHIADYITQGKPEAQRHYLLLHGYGQNGAYICKLLKNFLPKDSFIICPSGPFFISKKDKENERFVIRHSWYFYDFYKDEYIVDYELPSNYLKNFLELLKAPTKPLTIIGFSQGGYLAPFAAREIKNCDHVIGINCRFRSDLFTPSTHVKRYDAIHGADDEMVDPNKAHEAYEKLKEKGAKGSFFSVAGEGHFPGESLLTKLQELLSNHP